MALILHEFLDVYESASVSSVWKGLQILFYIIGAFTSIAATFSFGSIHYYYFDNNCILYSSVTFLKDGASTNCPDKGCNSTLDVPIGIIDILNTNWDKDDKCVFCIFTSVGSFITSLVWATFFTMCGKGGRAVGGLPSSWRIVFPALLINTTYFVISFVAACYMGNGMHAFCDKFMENMKETSCKALSKYDRSYEKRGSLYLSLSLIFIWTTTIIWLLSVVLLITRCMCASDFDLFRVEIQIPTFAEPEIASGADRNAIVLKKSQSKKMKVQTENQQQEKENNGSNDENQERREDFQNYPTSMVSFDAIKGAQLTIRQQDIAIEIFGNAKESVEDLIDLTHLNQKPTDKAVMKPTTSDNDFVNIASYNSDAQERSDNKNAIPPILITQHTKPNNILEIANKQNEIDTPQLYDTEINKIGSNSSWFPRSDLKQLYHPSNLDDISSYTTDDVTSAMEITKLCDDDSFKSAKSKMESTLEYLLPTY